MAVPFNLPSEPDPEDAYRRLDQLLIDLYEIVRLILLRSRPQTGEEVAEAPAPEERSLVRKPVPPPRRRRRRIQVPKPLPPPSSPETASWLKVGVRLRQIVQEFQNEDGEECRLELKASSLMSFLLPADLTTSLWTTVILLVGWKLLSRHR